MPAQPVQRCRALSSRHCKPGTSPDKPRQGPRSGEAFRCSTLGSSHAQKRRSHPWFSIRQDMTLASLAGTFLPARRFLSVHATETNRLHAVVRHGYQCAHRMPIFLPRTGMQTAKRGKARKPEQRQETSGTGKCRESPVLARTDTPQAAPARRSHRAFPAMQPARYEKPLIEPGIRPERRGNPH